MDNGFLKKSRIHSRHEGFVALETIAILIIAALVIVVAAAIILMPRNNPEQLSQDLPPIRNEAKIEEEKLDIQPISAGDVFTKPQEGPKYKSITERVYEYQKQHYENTNVITTTASGEIISIDASDGLKITLLSESYPVGVELDYFYEQSLMSKISVQDGTINDLTVGDKVKINDTIDYALSYPEALKQVEISKY